MSVSMQGLAFALAMALAALMGFAIQRGATCTVAAVDEIVSRRTAARLRAMLEASLWVALGLIAATQLHLTPLMPRGQPLSWSVFAGGVALGLGAWVNRACVFGAVARLGSGELAYLATPPGFFLGCLAYRLTMPALPQPVVHPASPVLGAAWVLLPMGAYLAWRIARAALDLRRGGEGAARVWTPGAATAVIAIAFVLLLLLVGDSWAYTDVLAELAGSGAKPWGWRMVLLACLFGGAVIGGYSAGRLRLAAPTWSGVLRCLAGGALMGFGSMQIPGSNDGMILLGMPLMLAHAWLGFTVMCLTVAAAMVWTPRLIPARRSA